MKTIERSVLNRMVREKSPDMPASIRVTSNLALHWTGRAWVRERVSNNDVLLVDGSAGIVLVKG